MLFYIFLPLHTAYSWYQCQGYTPNGTLSNTPSEGSAVAQGSVLEAMLSPVRNMLTQLIPLCTDGSYSFLSNCEGFFV
jgi:hypothetical protein